MTERAAALRVRTALETALPGASAETVKLWSCRLCVVRYAHAAGILKEPDMLRACETFRNVPLFADELPFPDSFSPALAALSAVPQERWADPAFPGWMYQYYNIPEREAAFSGIRSKNKISQKHLPAATQLFTPDWIVRCMTQNALGTLLEPLPDWKFYLRPQTSLPDLHKAPETITVLDPCMGTGHILMYVFDALLAQCRHAGIPVGAAARHILTRALFGLDIDGCAVKLAECMLRLKAAAYDPALATEKLALHFHDFSHLPETASLYGSLLRPEQDTSDPALSLLARQYDAVITNPPYMGKNSMDPALSAFVRKAYPDSKADLFAAFMERCAELTKADGCFSMVTQQVWMFLSTYGALRQYMRHYTLQSLVHLGMRAFSSADVGTIVQAAAFTAFGREIPDFRTTYIDLTEQEDKEAAFSDPHLRYTCTAEHFAAIPGQPLCYWVSDAMLRTMQYPPLGSLCRVCQGMTTSDNRRFVRRWYEVPPGTIAFGCESAEAAAATGKTWFPYNKGGRNRRWYGNHTHVVNYRNGGEALRAFHAELNKVHSGGRLKNADMYFRQGITWSFITEHARFGVRWQPAGSLFDVSGSCLFPEEKDSLYLMGLLASGITPALLRLRNPTLNFQPENLKALPVCFDERRRPEIEALVRECIAIARADWDSTEESWDFRVHPMIQPGRTLAAAYEAHAAVCRQRIDTMQRNEARLTALFAEIYELTEEHFPQPAVTLHHPSEREAAAGLVSFAAGCFFGRYQLEGVPVLAENFLSPERFSERMQEFLCTVYGKEHLAEDLQWLTAQLGDLEKYYQSGFYADHCRRFHKRPLYWMAHSGRNRVVSGLMYVHRMGESPIPLLRQITLQSPCSLEREDYLARLQALAGERYDPDAGIAEDHKKFSGAFMAIR